MITLQRTSDDGSKVTFELSEGIAMQPLYQELRNFCLAIGFHPETVEEFFGEAD